MKIVCGAFDVVHYQRFNFISYFVRSLALRPSSLSCLGGLLSLCLLGMVGCDSAAEPSGSNDSSAGSSPADGPPRDKVVLMLNWYPEAEHGGFYAADFHGYFADQGLDVEIRPGGPNAPVAQELVSGRVQFAVGNADDVLVYRAQKVPLVALMAPIQNTPRCIMVHDASSATSLSELAGLTLQAGAGRPYLSFMKSKGHLEGVQVVPYSGVPKFVADPQSAMQAYSFSEPMVALQQGAKTRTLMLSDVGFNPYASCLLATEDYIGENRDIVQRMVNACRLGWNRYFDSPEPTNQLILDLNSQGMTMDALDFGVNELRPLCLPEGVTRETIGTMSRERWQTLISQFAELDLLDPSQVDADQVFDAEFLKQEIASEAPPEL